MATDLELTPDQREQLLALPYLHDYERAALKGAYDRWNTTSLTVPESQAVYLLQRALTPTPCPACQAPLPEIAARTKDDPKDEDHHCPKCAAKLTFGIALIGGETIWTLSPGQKVVPA